MGTKLAMGTSYHPQSSGQVERYNQMLEQVLRLQIHSSENETDWESHIPTVQWVINNTPNRDTGYSPNFLLYGYHPVSPIQLLGGEHTNVESVNEFVERMKRIWSRAQTTMNKAREQMRQQANKRRRPQDFAVGDYVLLSTTNLKFKNYPRKLQRKFVGPFRVLERVGAVAYRLQLPQAWTIHPVFHTSLLKAWREGQWNQDLRAGTPELEFEGEPLYQVDKLLRWRWTGQGRRRQKEFLVLWEGYPLEEATWTRTDQFPHQDELQAMIQHDQPAEEATTSR